MTRIVRPSSGITSVPTLQQARLLGKCCCIGGGRSAGGKTPSVRKSSILGETLSDAALSVSVTLL